MKEGMTANGDLAAVEAIKDYLITVSLIEDSNITYLWSDETIDPILLYWSIEQLEVSVPVVSDFEFIYDTNSHFPNIEYDKRYVMLDGTSQIEADNYTIKFSLLNNKSCIWEDGTTDEKIYYWKIKKAIAKTPLVSNTEFDYDGTMHEPLISGFDPNSKIVAASGTLSAVNADKYQIVFFLASKKSCEWEDGSTEDKVYSWEIFKKSVSKPSISNVEFTYNGNAPYMGT
ncbi:MAG: hypothetical protein NC452_11715 [Eubacterium sp.]|nr:hypothetical protein [Eubacterium sp.]